ncbi:MAG: hypothetical protein WCQ95_03625 [Bacteroidota bacterium]
MKNSIKSFVILVVLCVAFNSGSFAQKTFRGVITLQLSYTGMDAATIAQLPKTKTVMLYDNLCKERTDYGMAYYDQIQNGDTKMVTFLVAQGEDKKYFKLNVEETKLLADKVTDTKITYTSITKTIAGYICKQAIINYKNEDGGAEADTVFYSDEVGSAALNFGSKYEGLKGYPMEYKVKAGELIISVTISEIKKGKVKDTDFLIPSDFTEATPDEKQQLIDQFTAKEE